MFQKGQSGNPSGRPKGAGNRATSEIKEAYQNLLEGNLENMNRWLTRLATEDEGKALDFMLKLSEYILPKLARQELVGKDGDDLLKNVTFKFGNGQANDNTDETGETEA